MPTTNPDAKPWWARSAGLLPLIAGLASAAALTGAAFYTAQQNGCGDPGHYVRHADHIEFVGGCVNGQDLPEKLPSAPSPNVEANDAGAEIDR